MIKETNEKNIGICAMTLLKALFTNFCMELFQKFEYFFSFSDES